MEDAWIGNEPQDNSSQYMQGYERSLQLEEEEQREHEEKKKNKYE